MDQIAAQVESTFSRTLGDLRRLVQIPSVAAQRRGIAEAAHAVSVSPPPDGNAGGAAAVRLVTAEW